MTVCAAFLTWEGWFPTTSESLDVCLNRRGLPSAIMLPSQLRYLSYFDSILQGTHISSESLRLSRITISCLPAIQNNSCSACIEVFLFLSSSLSRFSIIIILFILHIVKEAKPAEL